MNQQRIEKFNNELGAQLQQYQQLAQELDKLSGMAQMAASMGDRERGGKITEALMQQTPLLEGMVKAIQEKANRDSIEGAMQLYTDIAIRLQNANQIFHNWRGQVAAFELQAKLGEFKEPEQRATAEKNIADAKNAYEAQIELADSYVPDKATILSVAPVGVL